MSELATRTGRALEQPRHGPGSALGTRVKPTLRLAMGYRDEQRRGAPVKTDYFLPKLGAQGEYRAAAEKFTKVYGEKPRSVDIILPSSLAQALTIQHKAWGSSGEDEGGVLKAIGQTNFALEGTLGGADILTVFQPDGTIEEVEISGVDDPAAQKLSVDLYTTFRFQIPSVLGFGQYAEITSKGKQTTDTLWQRLVMLYDLFGARASFAVRPQLVLRAATARPLVKTKEGTKRIKSSFFALDLYMPESQDEMVERLRDFNASLGGASLYGNGGAAAALPESTSAGAPSPSPAVDAEAAADAAPPPRGAPAAASPTEEWPPEPDEDEPLEGEIVDPQASIFQAPTSAPWDTTVVPRGKYANKTVGEIAAEDAAYVREYLAVKIEAGEVKRAAVAWSRAHPA